MEHLYFWQLRNNLKSDIRPFKKENKTKTMKLAIKLTELDHVVARSRGL